MPPAAANWATKPLTRSVLPGQKAVSSFDRISRTSDTPHLLVVAGRKAQHLEGHRHQHDVAVADQAALRAPLRVEAGILFAARVVDDAVGLDAER